MSSTRSRHDIRTDARGQFRVTMHPADAPKSLWVGLVVGLLAFVVRITSQTMYTAPGVSECSFTDYGALVAAAICLLCGVSAIVRTVRGVDRVRMNPAVVHGVSALLLVLSVIHLLRGLGIVASAC